MKTRKTSEPKNGTRNNQLDVVLKGPLRNFHFAKAADDFLVDEKSTTKRDMVSITDAALLHFSQLAPEERDRLYRQYAPTLTR